MHDFVAEFQGTPFLSFVLAFLLLTLLLSTVVLVLWIAMPFSVFGVKGLLKKMIEEQKETNRLLNVLLARYGERREEKAVPGETQNPPE